MCTQIRSSCARVCNARGSGVRVPCAACTCGRGRGMTSSFARSYLLVGPTPLKEQASTYLLVLIWVVQMFGPYNNCAAEMRTITIGPCPLSQCCCQLEVSSVRGPSRPKR
jgi:hypothetical protein